MGKELAQGHCRAVLWACLGSPPTAVLNGNDWVSHPSCPHHALQRSAAGLSGGFFLVKEP